MVLIISIVKLLLLFIKLQYLITLLFYTEDGFLFVEFDSKMTGDDWNKTPKTQKTKILGTDFYFTRYFRHFTAGCVDSLCLHYFIIFSSNLSILVVEIHLYSFCMYSASWSRGDSNSTGFIISIVSFLFKQMYNYPLAFIRLP